METKDPFVIILEKTIDPPRVVYQNTISKVTWEILGTCNMCGECEVGGYDPEIVWTGVPVGQPGACYNINGENRLDNPILPSVTEKMQNCVLRGKYLDANN